ncbi:MAG TPA: GGDEF domain-containing protein [Acidimicrobiales bacterium]|nr:GGDEF domain-containing protein [Acidimicrobiales bacterium]
MRAKGDASGGQAETSLRSAFHTELCTATRESALLAGIIVLVAFPAWGVFDAILLPERWHTFMAVRLGFEIPILLVFLSLWWRRLGQRWPEQLSFALLALPELAIAWMIPRSEPQLEAYLLGFSLAIYGTAFLLVWRWQLSALLVGFTATATAVFTLTYRPGVSAEAVATIVAYLTTAGLIAVAGQLYRYRSGWQQFVTQTALEQERHRNVRLLDELRRLSHEDDLTGVANLRAWALWVEDAVRRAKRSRSPLSVIYCDFDRFKEVNDHHGHAVGDEVLQTGAAILRSRARASDFVARLGGDEFVVACPDTDLAGAVELAEELARLARLQRWPTGVTMTFSFGVAELLPDDSSPESLLARSDAALYDAKAQRDSVSTGGSAYPSTERLV